MPRMFKSDWIFSALATRIGTAISVGLVLLIGVGGSVFVRNTVSTVEENGTTRFNEPLREAIFALGDVQRLGYALQRAAAGHPPSPETALDFAAALDSLHIHHAALLQAQVGIAWKAEADQATLALSGIIEAGEAIAMNEVRISETDLAAFLDRAEGARAATFAYIDAIRLDHDAVLAGRPDTLGLLVGALEITLVVMGIIGVSAILLLHREVVSRQRRQAAERKADFLAYHDPLTELANRQKFNDHLAGLMEAHATTAMLFLDLDDFKGINDTYGHGFGDVVLKSIAERLRAAVESYGGMAARLGGDEFGALLPTDNATKLSYLCSEVLDQAARPISAEGVTIQAGVSIGVATSTEVKNATKLTPEAMSRAADFALYESKENGRGTYRIYDRALDARYVEHRALLDAIPAALDNQEFFVAYQPKVALAAGQIHGFEALIRWERDGVIVPPADFLPVAEESRLITRLDLMVLAEATRQISEWNAELGLALSVSVNLSALHFDDFAIIDEVKFALARANLPPELLTLELTETILLEDWEKVQDILSELRSLGCRISLDDFGTGYSSLAYLRRIEADELKIDRSFVIDIEDSQETAYILDAVVDIAKSLGMAIVVEGVEKEVQARIVESYGCDFGQGYLFGRPATAQATFARLNSGHGTAGTLTPEIETGREDGAATGTFG